MADKILLSLPKELKTKIDELEVLGSNGWSEEWQNKTKYIIEQLVILRDSSKISQTDFDYIRTKYLKSYGKISASDSSFFNFLINRNTNEYKTEKRV